MIASVSQYILSVENASLMSRNLGDMRLLRHDNGRPICYVGNSVIVFKALIEGEICAVRVYMRPHPNLRAIYRKGLYPRELFICHEGKDDLYADVVLCDWVEGNTLRSEIERSVGDNSKMWALSRRFEALATELLDKDWAHGDIKPENIIVNDEGMHLIDFDAVYRKGLEAEDCVELGTRPYQHPARSKDNFGIHIDDYPIALITTLLAALAYDPSLGEHLHNSEYLLVDPTKALEGCDPMLQRIEELFALQGDARHLRIAQLLHSHSVALPTLRQYLVPTPQPLGPSEKLSLECKLGLWGYKCGERWIIPPLYDLAFEFSEGVALVRLLNDIWHFIDEQGKVIITCGQGDGIKPMREGKTRIRRKDGDAIIYRDGRIEKL